MNQPAAGPAGTLTTLDRPAPPAPVPVDPLAGRKDWAAIVLLLVGGLFGVLQLTLKWFGAADGSWVTGWGWYYNTNPTGIGSIGASYAIMVCALAGVVMLLVGVGLIFRPASRRLLGTIGLIAGLVAVACALWWLTLGPLKVADAFKRAGIGWYLFLLAGLLGAVGGGKAKARRGLSFDKVSFMLVFLGLPLTIFVVFVIAPFIQAIYYSMTDWGGFTATMNFTGLDNYRKLLHDDTFRTALGNNILLGIVVPLVTIILALAIASMVTVGGPSTGPVRGLRASSFYRVVSFFPYCIPAIVIGLIWAQVYDPSAGILNAFLTGIGLSQFENFAWLGEVSTAMPASMFVIVWGFVGFYAVLFVAAIKSVPAETYEAARLDGAGRFRTAVSVTVPLIRDTVQTAYIYLGIAALDAFVYMQALNPFGGPNNSTLTMSQDLYNTAFRKGQFGYATAMGVTLAIVTLLFAALIFLVNRVTGGGKPGERA
jgi:N-acetylglucosamine transport system permease protein